MSPYHKHKISVTSFGDKKHFVLSWQGESRPNYLFNVAYYGIKKVAKAIKKARDDDARCDLEILTNDAWKLNVFYSNSRTGIFNVLSDPENPTYPLTTNQKKSLEKELRKIF